MGNASRRGFGSELTICLSLAYKYGKGTMGMCLQERSKHSHLYVALVRYMWPCYFSNESPSISCPSPGEAQGWWDGGWAWFHGHYSENVVTYRNFDYTFIMCVHVYKYIYKIIPPSIVCAHIYICVCMCVCMCIHTHKKNQAWKEYYNPFRKACTIFQVVIQYLTLGLTRTPAHCFL